jgi:hypothetical protein
MLKLYRGSMSPLAPETTIVCARRFMTALVAHSPSFSASRVSPIDGDESTQTLLIAGAALGPNRSADTCQQQVSPGNLTRRRLHANDDRGLGLSLQPLVRA